MAVVEVLHQYKERTGSKRRGGIRTSIEVYLVVTDNPKHGPLEVIDLANEFEQTEGNNVPIEGSSLFAITGRPRDAYVILHDTSAVPKADDPLTWRVLCTFETRSGGSGGGLVPLDPDPLQQRFRFQWGATSQRVVLDRTIASELNPSVPIRNSAGQRFVPPVEEDEWLPTLFFERNEAFDRIGQAGPFFNAVNNAPWSVLGFNAAMGQAKVIKMRSVYTLGRAGSSAQLAHYFVNSIEIVFREDGWDLDLLDEGTQELVQVPGSGVLRVLQNITDEEGQPLTEPQLLNGTGGRLRRGARPVFLPFAVRKRRSFGLLEIPTERPS